MSVMGHLTPAAACCNHHHAVYCEPTQQVTSSSATALSLKPACPQCRPQAAASHQETSITTTAEGTLSSSVPSSTALAATFTVSAISHSDSDDVDENDNAAEGTAAAVATPAAQHFSGINGGGRGGRNIDNGVGFGGTGNSNRLVWCLVTQLFLLLIFLVTLISWATSRGRIFSFSNPVRRLFRHRWGLGGEWAWDEEMSRILDSLNDDNDEEMDSLLAEEVMSGDDEEEGSEASFQLGGSSSIRGRHSAKKMPAPVTLTAHRLRALQANEEEEENEDPQQHQQRRFEGCAICLEQLCVGEQIAELQCRHTFHHPCVERWLRGRNSCPLCRAKQ